MAIVITITTSGTFNSTNSVSISDADGTRLLTAEKNIRGTPSSTNAQVWQSVCSDYFQYLKMRTKQWETASADASVTTITMT